MRSNTGDPHMITKYLCNAAAPRAYRYRQLVISRGMSRPIDELLFLLFYYG